MRPQRVVLAREMFCAKLENKAFAFYKTKHFVFWRLEIVASPLPLGGSWDLLKFTLVQQIDVNLSSSAFQFVLQSGNKTNLLFINVFGSLLLTDNHFQLAKHSFLNNLRQQPNEMLA